MANVSITCIDKISASNGHILIKVLPPTFCVKFGEINDRSRRTQPASPRHFIGLELMRWWLVIGQSSVVFSTDFEHSIRVQRSSMHVNDSFRQQLVKYWKQQNKVSISRAFVLCVMIDVAACCWIIIVIDHNTTTSR